jgi:serine/threonine protein kinase
LCHVFYQLVLVCNSLYNKKTLGQRYDHIGNACTPPLSYERANARPDIKPLNIFLKGGIQNEWPALKLPVLRDFGLYKILSADNVVTATSTPGFLSPQQYGPYSSTPIRTDVILVGWTIYCLMRWNLRGARFYTEEPPLDLESFLAEDDIRLGYDGIYTHRLRDLVDRCIKGNALERVGLKDLLKEVRDGRESCTDPNGGTWKSENDMDRFLPWNGVVFRTKKFDLSDPASPRQRTRRR